MGFWSAALPIIGGLFGKHESDKATDAQVKAQKEALALQREMWQQGRADQQPYMQFGQTQLGGLQSLLNGNSDGFMNSSWYKAGLKQANDEFNNGAAAKFRLFNGGTQNDRDQLNQDYALTHGIAPYAGMLQWGANLGQNAASGVGQMGQNYANAASGLYGNIGNAQATGYGNTAGIVTGLAGLLGNQFAGKSAYGGGSNASSFGLPAPVAPYANTSWGQPSPWLG